MRTEIAEARRAAAERAVELIQPGMIVGLGTGDTAAHAVRAVAGRVRDGLAIVGVATSRATVALATELGIPLAEPDAVAAIDLVIDGADEIDPALRLVKGGGGALTRERLVARAARRLVIVADAEKCVARLGEKRRLPVEIMPFGARWTLDRLAGELGLAPVLRMAGDAPTLTDGGGFLADCAIAEGADLVALAAALNGEPGVVDHGLFLDEASVAYIGHPGRVEERRRAT